MELQTIDLTRYVDQATSRDWIGRAARWVWEHPKQLTPRTTMSA